jgi:hypothetical protein
VAWDGAGNDLAISTMGRCVPRAPGLPKVWPTSVGASVRFLTLRWIFYRRRFGDGPSRRTTGLCRRSFSMQASLPVRCRACCSTNRGAGVVSRFRRVERKGDRPRRAYPRPDRAVIAAPGRPVGVGLLPYSGLMPAARTTLAHFSVSSAISLPNSAGEPGSGSPPSAASRAFIAGSAIAVLISLLSL